MNKQTLYKMLAQGSVIIALLTGLYIFLKSFLKSDGYTPSGKYDDDDDDDAQVEVVIPSYIPSTPPVEITELDHTTTYEQHPIELKYFKISDFDSKGSYDPAGTGVYMKTATLMKLEAARQYAEDWYGGTIKFYVNSGYRTELHNENEGGSSTSSHMRGYAIDIHAPTVEEKKKIVKALVKAGFLRFGIYNGFIHVDDDPIKKTPAVWKGDKVKVIPFNPFALQVA